MSVGELQMSTVAEIAHALGVEPRTLLQQLIHAYTEELSNA